MPPQCGQSLSWPRTSDEDDVWVLFSEDARVPVEDGAGGATDDPGTRASGLMESQQTWKPRTREGFQCEGVTHCRTIISGCGSMSRRPSSIRIDTLFQRSFSCGFVVVEWLGLCYASFLSPWIPARRAMSFFSDKDVWSSPLKQSKSAFLKRVEPGINFDSSIALA